MTKEELKKKCTERAKIFQQAMESCHSSNPIDCIEWFADRISELEKENAELKARLQKKINTTTVSDYPYSALKLEEAKEIIKELCSMVRELNKPNVQLTDVDYSLATAEDFLKECE